MICSSIILIFLCLPLPQTLIEKKQKFLYNFFIFLEKTSALDFLATIYVMFFAVSKKVFFYRMCIILFINSLYIIVSRLYFIETVFHHKVFATYQNILIYFVLLLGLSIIYLRFLLNLSIFATLVAYNIDPKLLSPNILYVLGDNDTPILEEKPSASDLSGTKRYSFININFSKNYFYQRFQVSKNTNTYKGIGLFLGFSTFIAASAAAYYGKLQVEATDRQTAATNRETDVAAVDAGLISKEEYYRRHPSDKPKV